MLYMAQTLVIQPAYVAIMQRERTPLLALGEYEGVLIPLVYRCGHVITEVVSRVGRIRLFQGTKFQSQRYFTYYFA